MATSASDRRDRRIHRILARLHSPLERLGLHLTRSHFYSPIPTTSELPADVFDRESEMPGVEMRDGAQLELLERIAPFIEECADVPESDPGGPPRFFLRNTQFERVDYEVLHSMVRLHQPSRIVEIGAGYSTLVSTAAARMNAADDPSYCCHHTCIDPVPREFLHGLDGVDELIAQPVQDVDPAVFEALEAGDILFIDSSHVVKIGSDAQFEFLELLPRIAPGVIVHVHDIFFPTDYPRGFVEAYRFYFNEQYVLQAFLAFNSQFEVLWSGSWMARRHEQLLRARFPSFDRGGHGPSSFWMRRVD